MMKMHLAGAVIDGDDGCYAISTCMHTKIYQSWLRAFPSLKLLLLVLTGATMVCKVVDSCVRIGQALLKYLPAHGLYNP